MARPRMIVVAGPPGSGKTRYFPVTAFGVDAFNIRRRRPVTLPRAAIELTQSRRPIATPYSALTKSQISLPPVGGQPWVLPS